MPYSVVQTKTHGDASYLNTRTISFDSSVTQGNLLIAAIRVAATNAITGFSDSSGDTWTLAESSANGNAINLLYYCPDASAGSHTLTIDTNEYLVLSAVLREYSGVQTTDPLDVSATGSDDESYLQTHTAGPTATTAQGQNLVIGSYASDYHVGSFSAGSGYGNTAYAQGFEYSSVALVDKESTTVSTHTSTIASTEYLKGAGVIAVFKLIETVTDTYYFDGHNGISDPDGVWSFDSNAFKSTPSQSPTFLQAQFVDSVPGSKTTRYLQGLGTTAPTSGKEIVRVRLRIAAGNAPGSIPVYGTVFTSDGSEELGVASANNVFPTVFGGWITLTTPIEGWTWPIINELRIRFWGDTDYQDAYQARASANEVEVTYLASSEVDVEVPLDSQSLTLALNSPTVTTQIQDDASPSAQSLTLQAPAISLQTERNPVATPAAQSLALTQQNPTVTKQRQPDQDLPAMGLALSAPDVSIYKERQHQVSAGNQTLTLTTAEPTIYPEVHQTVPTSPDELMLTAMTPTVGTERNPVSSLSDLSLSLSLPEVTAATQVQTTLQLEAQALSLTALDPAVGTQLQPVHELEAQSLGITQPVVGTSVERQPVVGLDTLSVALSTPEISVATQINTQHQLDALQLALSAPDVETAHERQPIELLESMTMTLEAESVAIATSTGTAVGISSQTLSLLQPDPTTESQRQPMVSIDGMALSMFAVPVGVQASQGQQINLSPLSLSLTLPAATVITQTQETASLTAQALTLSMPAVQVLTQTQESAVLQAQSLSLSAPTLTVVAQAQNGGQAGNQAMMLQMVGLVVIVERSESVTIQAQSMTLTAPEVSIVFNEATEIRIYIPRGSFMGGRGKLFSHIDGLLSGRQRLFEKGESVLEAGYIHPGEE